MPVSHQLITAVEQKSFQTLFKSYRILAITMTYLAAIFFFIFRKVQVGQIVIIIKKITRKKITAVKIILVIPTPGITNAPGVHHCVLILFF